MICDNCIKKSVCKFKENCNILERDTKGSNIEGVITLELKCKEKVEAQPLFTFGKSKWGEGTWGGPTYEQVRTLIGDPMPLSAGGISTCRR